ncbi:hypothetical protein E4191_08440 [Paracoccus liaowanqingii]|uniref:Succinate dehydrogenase n=1 Tax=Paracoccus liaowanqingii TaxID=2560053 RepID=A0A4P7HKM6_9RHOB|nr:hypothetical protein [Paracoccus liaowanqingii]QBX34734.1 hypothetical protein E4191_08440 [Paracoccus liaowanqingii]
MRFNLLAACGLAVATLAGCVAPIPMAAPVVPSAPIATTPTILDAASRQIVRNVVDSEMQRRLPGVNVSPYTDCVINNATTAELIDIAQMSRSGIAGTADSVASIVSRPTTTQCIAAAARTA